MAKRYEMVIDSNHDAAMRELHEGEESIDPYVKAADYVVAVDILRKLMEGLAECHLDPSPEKDPAGVSDEDRLSAAMDEAEALLGLGLRDATD